MLSLEEGFPTLLLKVDKYCKNDVESRIHVGKLILFKTDYLALEIISHGSTALIRNLCKFL